MKLKLIETPTIEVRGDDALFIFPSRPYWFAASADVVDIVSLFSVEVESDEALSSLSEQWGEEVDDV